MSLSDVVAIAKWADSLGLAVCYVLWRWTRRQLEVLRAELDRRTDNREGPRA